MAYTNKQHLEAFPPVDVTLPWLRPDGPLVTERLFTRLDGAGALRRTDFNDRVWKLALGTAGLIPKPKPESATRPPEVGHSDPGVFMSADSSNRR